MKDVIKPIAVLAGICLVVTALLAYINSVTAPIITEAEAKKAAEARAEVLSEADSFKQLDIELPEGVENGYEAENGAGYVFTVNSKGYGGDVKVICGVKPDGSIEQIKTLSHSETSGIGTRVVDNDSGYREKYFGKTSENYEDVDAVSGATISSKAYRNAVKLIFDAYSAAKEAK